MAKDSTGRPIPVYIPPAPDRVGRPTPEQEQFMIAAQKVDEALHDITDLSVRVGNVESSTASDFNAALLDFEQRFDTMMLARLTDFQRQIDAAVSAFQRSPPDPELEPEAR